MNPIELEEQKKRLITALVALIFAFLVIAIVSLLVQPAELEVGQIQVSDVLFDRGNSLYPFTIQNIMWVLFFIGLGELWVRLSRAKNESRQLRYNILPEGEDTMLRAKDLVPIYTAN